MNAQLLKAGLQCKEVYTVIPFSGGFSELMEHKLLIDGFVVCEISGLLLALKHSTEVANG